MDWINRSTNGTELVQRGFSGLSFPVESQVSLKSHSMRSRGPCRRACGGKGRVLLQDGKTDRIQERLSCLHASVFFPLVQDTFESKPTEINNPELIIVNLSAFSVIKAEELYYSLVRMVNP